jgi:sugar lactone lactonase YvrE
LAALGQTAHFSGAESVVVASGLDDPHHIAVDIQGNLYIADQWNNRVLKETPSGSGYTQSTIGSGLFAPIGVSVDSAGNVYIADTYNGRVLKETLSGAGYTQSTILDGLNFPYAVVVDPGGNIYIADTNSSLVLKETPSGSGYTQSTIGSGLIVPADLALDGSGNVYITDEGNNRVLKETPSGNTYTQSVVAASGLNTPFGLAVDGSGNVYFTDWGNRRVLKETLSGSTYTQSVVLASGLTGPSGVAVDGNGDIFISDSNAQNTGGRVLEVSPSGANFGTVIVGTTSPAITFIFTFDSAGVLGSTAVLTQGATGLDFADSHGGSCKAGKDYSEGATCTVTGTLKPRVAGARFGAVELKSESGAAIATGYAYGVGSGPQVAFTPGTITTVAGDGYNICVGQSNCGGYSGDGGQATSAELSWPTGVALDGAGNLYIADLQNNRVREVNAATGIITTIAGTGTGGFSGDNGPATSAELNAPNRLVIDGAGNLFISDFNNNRIRRVDAATGIITTFAGNGPVGHPVPSGFFGGDGGPAASAELCGPAGMAFDSAGNLYIADSGNVRLRKVDAATGIITTVAGNGFNPGCPAFGVWGGFGGDGGPATSAELSLVSGVAFDNAGNMYLADTQNSRIRRVDAATGIITTISGNGSWAYNGDGIPAANAELNQPLAVQVDSAGNLYIDDNSNNRMRKVDAITGIITTVAGNGYGEMTNWGGGYTGDGGPATSAEMANPNALILDGVGNMYIADTRNNVIRKVNISTVGLSFATTTKGSTSSDSPETVIVENLGNAPLSLSAVSYPADFPESSAGTTDCAATTLLPEAWTCTLTIDFTPVAAIAAGASKTLSESVKITTNSLNAANVKSAIAVTGTEKAPPPPVPPTPISPANGATLPPGTTSTTLTWSSVSGTTSYTVQVFTGSCGGTLFRAGNTGSNTSYTVSGLGSGMTYYWWVQATGSGGNSGYSSCFSFRTPPAVPKLLTPANGATVLITAPTVTWSSVSGASNYAVQLFTGSCGGTLVGTGYPGLGTSFQFFNLINGTTYWWQVDATGGTGTSNWSPCFSFSVIGPPAVPTPLTPANGATVTTTSPTVTWSKVSGASSYSVQVFTGSCGGTLVGTGYPGSNTKFQFYNLAHGTTYWWQVDATGSGGTSNWSSCYSFSVQ